MPEERGIVNEMAFRLFMKWCQKGIDSSLPKEFIPKITNDAVNFIKRFRDVSIEKYKKPSVKGKNEAIAIAKNLRAYFSKNVNVSKIIFFPQFSGCGCISDCEGDIMIETTLYEIKSGDRGFRLVDLRQVLVYCALNYIKHTYLIENIVLLNPRRGVLFPIKVDSLCREITGSDMFQVFQDITEFASQSQSSK